MFITMKNVGQLFTPLTPKCRHTEDPGMLNKLQTRDWYLYRWLHKDTRPEGSVGHYFLPCKCKFRYCSFLLLCSPLVWL